MNQLPNTTAEQAKYLPKIHVHGGLYFVYNGEKRTPSNLYFSADLRDWWNDPRHYGGRCFTHYDNALRPVYAMDGKQYEERDIRCISADYDADTHIIYNFRKA